MTCERMTLGAQFPADVETEHLERYRHAKDFVAGLDVLDVACGTGYGSHFLATNGARSVRGIDVAPEAIEYARHTFLAENLTFELGNAQQLTNVADSSVDVVVSMETIEHLPDVQSYLAEIRRVLRPGGRYMVSTPDRHFSTLYPLTRRPNNPFHVIEYTRSMLDDLLSKYLRVEHWYGQAYINRLLVFWPLQVFIKAICYVFRRFGAYRLVRRWYHQGTGLHVQGPGLRTWALPRFWIVHCVKPPTP